MVEYSSRHLNVEGLSTTTDDSTGMEKLANIHHKVAISSGTVVEYLPCHIMVAGLSPAIAAYLKVEGLSLAASACTGSEKSVKRFHLKMTNCGCAVVEHSPHHLMVEGLSLAVTACTGSEKSVKRFHLKMATSGLVALW